MRLRVSTAAICVVGLSCGGPRASSPTDLLPDNPEVSRSCRDDLAITDVAQCREVAAMLLPASLPPSRGNAVADSLPAAQLGFQIFFDSRFSTIPGTRCATCHLPEDHFTDARQVSAGPNDTSLPRNSLSTLTAAWNPGNYFWDGRADSLWSQPLFPLENAAEMATTRLTVAHAVATNSIYLAMYGAVFDPMPDISDSTRFPPSGMPGDAAFDSMAIADQEIINQFWANFGKALEAYMRNVATGRSPLDAYLLGNATALQSGQLRGLSDFVKAGCTTCHGGPTLSDGLYYDMKIPSLPGAAPDTGRAAAIAILDANPFNAQGPYYDRGGAPAPPPPAAATVADANAFRTPSLRNVAITGPYGHNGYYATLRDLLATHGPTKLTPTQISDITAFLFQLGGAYPQRPWSNWPTN
jgi:cytochrome c peroxidase